MKSRPTGEPGSWPIGGEAGQVEAVHEFLDPGDVSEAGSPRFKFGPVGFDKGATSFQHVTVLQVAEVDANAPGSKRQASVRARRRRILEAAQVLIHEEGLGALSMRRLAAAADVSVTTLYNLFDCKEGVVGAMFDAAMDDMDARLDVEAPPHLDPFGRCRAVISVSIEHLGARPEVYRPAHLAALERLARGEPDDRRLARRAAGMQVQGLAAARDQGLLRPGTDIEAVASQIYHGYELAAMQWAHGQLDLEAFEARALYGLWIALLAVCTESERSTLERELTVAGEALRATAGTAEASTTQT